MVKFRAIRGSRHAGCKSACDRWTTNCTSHRGASVGDGAAMNESVVVVKHALVVNSTIVLCASPHDITKHRRQPRNSASSCVRRPMMSASGFAVSPTPTSSATHSRGRPPAMISGDQVGGSVVPATVVVMARVLLCVAVARPETRALPGLEAIWRQRVGGEAREGAFIG